MHMIISTLRLPKTKQNSKKKGEQLRRGSNSLILSQEDPNTRIDAGSQKESPKEEKDDDDDALIRREWTETKVYMFDVPSRSSSYRAKHLRGVIAKVTKHRNKMIKNMKKNFTHRSEVQNLGAKIRDTFDKEVFPLVEDRMEDIPPASIRIPALQEQLYKAMKDSSEAQVADSDIWVVLKEKFDKEEEFIPHILEKEAPLFLGPQRDPNEPLRFIWNKDLFCLKNGNTKAKKYVLSLYKIHATPFPKNDLESENEQGYGQDFMEEIVVKRADEKAYIFSKSDYKYLNKNDTEDMYFMCLRREVDYQKNRLLKSLTVFIRSCVIWERVHDYQLGIESCQIKINLTAPTLITPGIKNFELYSIITDPFIRIMYENSKKEKRVMNIDELPKFYDATLNRVLRKVEEINVEARYRFKDPPLSKEEKEVIC
ncbi:hypothetical protein Tco_1267147 [Tanacetum coccineum]